MPGCEQIQIQKKRTEKRLPLSFTLSSFSLKLERLSQLFRLVVVVGLRPRPLDTVPRPRPFGKYALRTSRRKRSAHRAAASSNSILFSSKTINILTCLPNNTSSSLCNNSCCPKLLVYDDIESDPVSLTVARMDIRRLLLVLRRCATVADVS